MFTLIDYKSNLNQTLKFNFLFFNKNKILNNKKLLFSFIFKDDDWRKRESEIQ